MLKDLGGTILGLLLVTAFQGTDFSTKSLVAETPPNPSYLGSIASQEAQAVIASGEVAQPGVEYFTLGRCIQIALEHNAQIQIAKARIEAQSGVRITARALLLPQVEAKGLYKQVAKDSLPSFAGQNFGSDKYWRTEILAQQALYTGGAASAEWRQASYLEQAATFEFAAVVGDVSLQVQERFFAVLMAKSQIEVRTQAVELLEKLLELEKNKLGAGSVSEFNVLRAEVELANAKAPLIRARNAFRLSLEELAQVLGLRAEDASDIKPALRIQGALLYEDLGLDLPGAVAAAKEQRPELKRLELVVKAAKEGVRIAQAGYLPNLALQGGNAWESDQFGGGLSTVEQGWFTGVQANWRLFDSLATRGRVQQAEAGELEVQVLKEQELINIEVEVRRALSSLVEARELVDASKKVVAEAEESLRLVEARLEAGAARQVDALDTRVALTQARSNRVEALFTFNLAKARLERAIGSNAAKN